MSETTRSTPARCAQRRPFPSTPVRGLQPSLRVRARVLRPSRRSWGNLLGARHQPDRRGAPSSSGAFPIVLIGQLLVTGRLSAKLVSKWPFPRAACTPGGARTDRATGTAGSPDGPYMLGPDPGAVGPVPGGPRNSCLVRLVSMRPATGATVLTGLAVLIFGSAAKHDRQPAAEDAALHQAMTLRADRFAGPSAPRCCSSNRTHSFSVLFTSAGTGPRPRTGYSVLSFGVVAFIGFSFLGFESAGSIRRGGPGVTGRGPAQGHLPVPAGRWGSLVHVREPGHCPVGSRHRRSDLRTRRESHRHDPWRTRPRLGHGGRCAADHADGRPSTASLIGVQAAVTRAIWASRAPTRCCPPPGCSAGCLAGERPCPATRSGSRP